MLEAIITRARAGLADRLLLEVREHNEAALAFYAGKGFIEIDRRARYYRDGTTAVVMRRDLQPGHSAQ
jgi:[ribosomal protein S18]-alanine N-acetyltransferase